MITQSIATNVAVRTIESTCKKFDIDIKESHKAILAVLIPAVIFRDGKIIIMAETIHQVNRIVQKHNERIDIVSILLGLNCISHISKYGTITIPISILLDKLKVKREIIGAKDKYISKKVLTNATQTLCLAETLNIIGIPKAISIPIINILFEWIYSDIDKEYKTMIDLNVAFKNHKMSEIKKILYNMHFEKIFLSTAILLIITEIGFKISSSLIIVSVLSNLYEVLSAEYKMKTAKGFLN
jgi:hypothetical protein